MNRSYNKKRRPWELKPREYNRLPGQGRKSTNQWFYQSKPWKIIRKIKLQMDPFCQCERCKIMGRTQEANTVDHIIPINPVDPFDTQGGKYGEPLELENLMSMTTRCHNRKSGKEAHKHGNS